MGLARDNSSTDCDNSFDSPSPHYYKASEIHDSDGRHLHNPDKHIYCKPHPPPLSALQGDSNDTSNHDYESLPTSFDAHSLATYRRGHITKEGSHDYAFIGPAPSMETLSGSEEGLPFVPEGGMLK